MARPPSPLDLSLHAHFGILAQRRRGFFRDPDKAAIETRRVPIDRRSPSRDQPLPRRVQSTVQTLRLDRRSKQNHRRCQTRAPSVRFDPLALQPKGDEDLHGQRITDCTRDAGGYGVCVLEVSGFHRPRECRDDEFTHICYYYDLDMFDLPVLPKCLTGLLTKERVLASSPLISSRSQEQQFRTRRGSLKGLRGYKK